MELSFPSVRLVHTLTGLEMEQVRENQGKPVRFDLAHRPLLLSSSGHASHCCSSQVHQVWVKALTHTLKDAICRLG